MKPTLAEAIEEIGKAENPHELGRIYYKHAGNFLLEPVDVYAQLVTARDKRGGELLRISRMN